MEKHYNYSLEVVGDEKKAPSFTQAWQSYKRFTVYMHGEGRQMFATLVVIVLGSLTSIATPYYIATATDRFIVRHDTQGLLGIVLILTVIYLASLVVNYYQAFLTGSISQRTLFRLREAIFGKLQSLPTAFFNQNKAGDIISRINNDTDKINNFLSQGLGRFIGNVFTVTGIGIFIFFLNAKLSLVLLSSVLLIILATRLLSPWSERLSKRGLASLGSLSSEVQESLSSFKVIVAFNRRNYFEQKIQERNVENFKNTVLGSLSSELFRPVYDAAGNIAQLVVLTYGLYLITKGELSIGLLIGFISYTQRFYDPIRMIGSVWGDVQTALASWSRLTVLLQMQSTLLVVPEEQTKKIPEEASSSLLFFNKVDFGYHSDQLVLKNINLQLEKGKTYALVGPTGGGKSTMASLMVRLYDPTKGTIYFKGKDLRTYTPEYLADTIGFILQDPFLFSGTIHANICYGNPNLLDASEDEVRELLEKEGLIHILSRFEHGLSTVISDGSENISLGQKQLLSFIRTVLRNPELLLLDEATANIDTVTEQQLTEVISRLPKDTTKVIIAHRLNTIKDADEIIFINAGKVNPALDFESALMLLDNARRKS